MFIDGYNTKVWPFLVILCPCLVCLITGANRGIGLIAAHKYAAARYEVIMACRDEVKGQEAVGEVQKANPTAKVSFLKVGKVLAI